MSLDHVAALLRPHPQLLGLSYPAYRVLVYAAFRANRTKDRYGNPPDVAPVTPQQIARATLRKWDGAHGTTARAIRRAIAELEAADLVERVPNANPKVRADALLLLSPLSDSYKTERE